MDREALERLRELGKEIGNDRFLAQMAQTFLECMPTIEALREKIDEADGNAVVDMAHSLRGNSASFGALRLAELAAELESLADRGGLAEPWPRWGDFLHQYERVSTELRGMSGA